MTNQEIKAICEEIVTAHPKKLKEYRDGNKEIFAAFIVSVFQKCRGLADPKAIVKELKLILTPT